MRRNPRGLVATVNAPKLHEHETGLVGEPDAIRTRTEATSKPPAVA